MVHLRKDCVTESALVNLLIDLKTEKRVLLVCFELQMALVGIARRRTLLTDDVLLSLIDPSWEILDLSGSDVSDVGLIKVADICKFL